MLDGIRHCHPNKSLFTRPHKKNGKVISWSRIDHVLLDQALGTAITDVRILYDAPYSDHRPVQAQLSFRIPHLPQTSLPSSSSSLSRISPALFCDPTFAAELSAWYTHHLSPALDHLLPADQWEEKKAKIASFASRAAKLRYNVARQELSALTSTVTRLEESAPLSPPQQEEYDKAHLSLRTFDIQWRKILALRSGVPILDGAPAEAAALHRRLTARKAVSTFSSLLLSDTTTTTDIATALPAVDAHFQRIFSLAPHPAQQVAAASRSLLAHLSSSSRSSDHRLARRWDPASASALDAPFTVDEVKAASRASPQSSSPGPSGLPYKFYQQNSTLLASELADAFNDAWDRGSLPPSLATAHVRLLNKKKPGADVSSLTSYRPISLREADYRLLSRILVCRLSPLLSSSIPPSQGGFVPGRRSDDLGRHLQFLLEEVSTLDYPSSALISLDQSQAYDRVSHTWLFKCYEAFGALPRFLRLLRTLYDSTRLRARYNVNGFLTEGIALLTGLPQGDPLSCASWLISFQPFLDALVLRKIALSLPSPISVTRSDIITSVAFAADTTLAISSLSAALPLLEQLAVDWKAASNGRLNTEKTVVLPVGSQAGADPLAGIVAWVGVEGFATWAGFPLSASSPPDAYYASLLSRIQHRLTRAIGIYSSLRSRVIYANTHILSLSLHLLSFHPAPSSVLHGLEHALLSFVWGGTKDHPYRKGAVKKEFVFLPTSKGGLGLLSPYDFNRANTLCFLSTLLTSTNSLWHDLALSSFRRHLGTPTSVAPSLTSPTSAHSRTPWSIFRASSIPTSHPLWSAVVATARKHRPSFHLPLLSSAHLLDLPPSLFPDAPSLKHINSISSLHFQHAPSFQLTPYPYTLQPPSPPYPSSAGGLRRARHDWLSLLSISPLFLRFASAFMAVVPLPLPPSLPPPPTSFSFLGLTPTFSTADARQALVALLPSAPLHHSLSPLAPSPLSPSELDRPWRWIIQT
ncbi:hypothetical protein JCM11641_003394 [Rhodosporidiobolus odoratus]